LEVDADTAPRLDRETKRGAEDSGKHRVPGEAKKRVSAAEL
jgi:hypothetical protein